MQYWMRLRLPLASVAYSQCKGVYKLTVKERKELNILIHKMESIIRLTDDERHISTDDYPILYVKPVLEQTLAVLEKTKKGEY